MNKLKEKLVTRRAKQFGFLVAVFFVVFCFIVLAKSTVSQASSALAECSSSSNGLGDWMIHPNGDVIISWNNSTIFQCNKDQYLFTGEYSYEGYLYSRGNSKGKSGGWDWYYVCRRSITSQSQSEKECSSADNDFGNWMIHPNGDVIVSWNNLTILKCGGKNNFFPGEYLYEGYLYSRGEANSEKWMNGGWEWYNICRKPLVSQAESLPSNEPQTTQPSQIGQIIDTILQPIIGKNNEKTLDNNKNLNEEITMSIDEINRLKLLGDLTNKNDKEIKSIITERIEDKVEKIQEKTETINTEIEKAKENKQTTDVAVSQAEKERKKAEKDQGSSIAAQMAADQARKKEEETKKRNDLASQYLKEKQQEAIKAKEDLKRAKKELANVPVLHKRVLEIKKSQATTTVDKRTDAEVLAGKSFVINNQAKQGVESPVVVYYPDIEVTANSTDREKGIIEKAIPFASSNKLFGITVAASQPVKKASNTLDVFLTIDSDVDGLPDDLEKRYSTNPNKFDTDGDGYGDWTEIKNGYDALGSGKKKYDLQPVEKAIIDRVKIEQPRSDIIVNDKVVDIKSLETSSGKTIEKDNSKQTKNNQTDKNSIEQGENMSFAGKAKPNETVALFIYSQMPIVVTAKADSNGNWIFDLDKTLINGQHDAYVVVTDDKGKIKAKSSPLVFFVNEAKAVTNDMPIAGEVTGRRGNDLAKGMFDARVAQFREISVFDDMLIWYVIGGAILTISLFGFYLLLNNKKNEK